MANPPLKIDIKGMEGFEKALKELPGMLQKRVVLQGFRAGAKIIEERALELVPGRRGRTSLSFNKSAGVKRDKGAKKQLFETIKTVRPSRKKLVENREVIFSVRATHPLAWLAEFGSGPRVRRKSGGSTGIMPASAFMRRSVDEKGAAAIDAITEKCRTLLNAAVARMNKGRK